MTEHIPTTESKTPDQLIESRTVGQIDTASLPWIDHAEEPQPVVVSELKFSDGTIYVASAIPESLRNISQLTREQDRLGDGEHYGLSDMMLIKAAQIEAGGQSLKSGRISGLRGDIDPDYAKMSIRAFKEGQKANTRRMYYGLCSLSTFGFTPFKDDSIQTKPEDLLIIRLGLSDKAHQIRTLSELTTQSVRQLRKWGAGSE